MSFYRSKNHFESRMKEEKDAIHIWLQTSRYFGKTYSDKRSIVYKSIFESQTRASQDTLENFSHQEGIGWK